MLQSCEGVGKGAMVPEGLRGHPLPHYFHKSAPLAKITYITYSYGQTSGYFVDANVQCSGSIGVKRLLFSLQQPIWSCVKYTGCDVAPTDRI